MMSLQGGHAQSCIFWNLGVVRLKSSLYYALVLSLDVEKTKSMKLGWWWTIYKNIWASKGRFPKPLWDRAAPIAVSICRADFPCTEQVWSVEMTLLFPNWVERISIVLKCEVRSFSCSMAEAGSIQCALSKPVCLWAMPGSLPRFLLEPQKHLGGTPRGSSFTGCSFDVSFFSDYLFGTYYSVDVQPDILLPSTRIPGPSIPALPWRLCPPQWDHSSLCAVWGIPDSLPSSTSSRGNKSILREVTPLVSNMLSTWLVFSLAGAKTKLQARKRLWYLYWRRN